MGRKIPLPKRHFGVRDPLQQRKEREEKIKDKINNPPKDFNQQEVSKKFKSFIKLKEAAQSGKEKKALKRVDDDFNSTKIDLDGIKRNANETDRKFLRRVNRLTHQRRLEAGFAAKYNVDIIRNQDTGEIKLKKKPKDQIEELMKKRRAEAKSGKKKFVQESTADDEPKLSSLAKLKLKKKAKKDSVNEEKTRVFAEYQHEVIKFGETVQAPPTLVKPRKAAKTDTVPRPGQRNLLLTSMLQSSEAQPVKKSELFGTKPNKIFKGPVDRKGKRKNLPNSTRIALESERLNAVDLYRQLKKKQPIVPLPNKNIEEF